MKDVKLEIGQIWIGKTTKAEKQILAIGDSAIFFKALNSLNEDVYSKDCFIDDHTLKKPEQKLKKLVLWVRDGAFVSIGFDDIDSGQWKKKPIIIKDGELFVEDA